MPSETCRTWPEPTTVTPGESPRQDDVTARTYHLLIPLGSFRSIGLQPHHAIGLGSGQSSSAESTCLRNPACSVLSLSSRVFFSLCNMILARTLLGTESSMIPRIVRDLLSLEVSLGIHSSIPVQFALSFPQILRSRGCSIPADVAEPVVEPSAS